MGWKVMVGSILEFCGVTRAILGPLPPPPYSLISTWKSYKKPFGDFDQHCTDSLRPIRGPRELSAQECLCVCSSTYLDFFSVFWCMFILFYVKDVHTFCFIQVTFGFFCTINVVLKTFLFFPNCSCRGLFMLPNPRGHFSVLIFLMCPQHLLRLTTPCHVISKNLLLWSISHV